MAERQRQSEIFLLPEDEIELYEEIRRNFPNVKLVDNSDWLFADIPPVRESPSRCSRYAALWNTEIYPSLPVSQGEDGRIRGPQVGPVVQWLRSGLDNNRILQAGRWAATYSLDENPEMAKFVDRIWKILNSSTTNKLVGAGPIDRPPVRASPIRSFRIGYRALEDAKAGAIQLASGRLRLLPELSWLFVTGWLSRHCWVTFG
jgi:hypothetical protein